MEGWAKNMHCVCVCFMSMMLLCRHDLAVWVKMMCDICRLEFKTEKVRERRERERREREERGERESCVYMVS